ncbi:hypothetical protein OG893_34005 [Streptomyces sp. NBC_01696]|uniref:hypothetical protein n=1 Tax=unclassified Streptomyces TaxID=2593676 RepID=UPI002E2FA6FA|nr:hypothetical protein [Streptomyces sp. NBC_01696]
MNGIQLTLSSLHRGERSMATALVAMADGHLRDHEVHHVAIDIAAWSLEHVQRLAEASARHGTQLDDRRDGASDDLLAAILHAPSGQETRRPDPRLLLLDDLRDLHLAATRNSLHWEMLAQVAQATAAADLLALASSCHPQTLRQMHWTNTMIKTLSPQVLSSL